MKISIITPVFNGKKTIRETLKSVVNQEYGNIEHIVIDGHSTDGTLETISDYNHQIAKVVSEPDQGIYDALNKGIRLSTGDIIGILHAGDLYAHDRVLRRVAEDFERQNKDSCYGDLQYVDPDDPEKVIRYWKSSSYREGKFKLGWMPPHPTFFVKRESMKNMGFLTEIFELLGITN